MPGGHGFLRSLTVVPAVAAVTTVVWLGFMIGWLFGWLFGWTELESLEGKLSSSVSAVRFPK